VSTVTLTRANPRRCAGLIALLVVFFCALAATAANAAPASVGWMITSTAEPSDFSTASNAACENEPAGVPPRAGFCNSYRIVVRNTGSAATQGIVRVTDVLPAGLTPVFVAAEELQPGEEPELYPCSTVAPRCGLATPMQPGGVLVMTVNVIVTDPTPRTVVNTATVEGGSETTPTAATGQPGSSANTINEGTPSFAITGFDFVADGPDGLPDNLAGGHPYSVSASLTLPTFDRVEERRPGQHIVERKPVQQVRDIVVNLPLGFVGNPQAAERCPLARVIEVGSDQPPNCPAGSRVGRISFAIEGVYRSSEARQRLTSAIFNVSPERGFPAEFGFTFIGKVLFMYGAVVRRGDGYVLRVAAPGVPETNLHSANIEFFGVPADHDGGGRPPVPFFTNPVTCGGGPLTASAEADSWEEPSRWVKSAPQPVTFAAIEGCDSLQFRTDISMTPETTTRDTPSGYEVHIAVPQAPSLMSVQSTAELKDTRIVLPPGVSLSPPAAEQLTACPESGPGSIEMPTGEPASGVPGEGEAIGLDGLPHLTAGHCPAGSSVASVEIATPLLESPLTGHLYLAQPQCGGIGQDPCVPADAEDGRLYSVYLEAAGAGVVVKLKGTVSVNSETGQVTVIFDDAPQFPFSDLRVRVAGGAHAPLANPQTCGANVVTSHFVPWSAPVTADATPSATFPTTGCSGAPAFSPGFVAGSAATNAGGSGPFTVRVMRADGEEGLRGLTTSLPPGLTGIIAKVPLCPEPQATLGTCTDASRIGTAAAAAGSGPDPLWQTGRIYLTGPYNGAPFGLSIVVPAKAGPFNLGDIVVRAAITVDPVTAAVTVSTQPLPTSRDGVPLRLREIVATIDRPGFMLNPTNCGALHIDAAVHGLQGSTAHPTSPFSVSGCSALAFKPSLEVRTNGRTSKARGASLDVKVRYHLAHEANIHAVKVELPLHLPSRLTTLQKACIAVTFATNPAACPPESVVGIAQAVTPVLPAPLRGPAYLVSHGGAAFPDLVIVLQGDGVRVDLIGHTSIRHGITRSSFDSVPDVPVSSFEVYFPQGKHSLLAALGNLCKLPLAMPTTFVGQNGRILRQRTHVNVVGCASRKTARSHRAAVRHRRERRPTKARR
jgi:Domain of unknown function DUF11